MLDHSAHKRPPVSSCTIHILTLLFSTEYPPGSTPGIKASPPFKAYICTRPLWQIFMVTFFRIPFSFTYFPRLVCIFPLDMLYYLLDFLNSILDLLVNNFYEIWKNFDCCFKLYFLLHSIYFIFWTLTCMYNVCYFSTDYQSSVHFSPIFFPLFHFSLNNFFKFRFTNLFFCALQSAKTIQWVFWHYI